MAEVWEPGAKQTEFSLVGRGVAGFKGRAWLTDRALLEGPMAAEQRDWKGRRRRGEPNGRGFTMPMTIEVKQEGQIHRHLRGNIMSTW